MNGLMSQLVRHARTAGQGLTRGALQIEGKFHKTLGNQQAATGDFIKAIENHKKALDIAQKRGDKEEEVRAYGDLGKLYFQTKDYELSVYYLNEYLNIARHDRAEKAWAYKILGFSHFSREQFNEAITYLNRCLERFKELKDDQEVADVSFKLGVIYSYLEKYEEAIEELNESLRIFEDLRKYKNIQQQIHQELGCVYRAMNQHETAAGCFQRSLELAKELQDKEKIAEAYACLGNVHLSQNQPQDAFKYLQKSRTKALKAGNREKTSTANENIGRAYLINHEPREAIKYYKQCFTTVDETTDRSELASLNFNMGQCYNLCEEYELAIEYFRKSLELLQDKKMEAAAHAGLGKAYHRTWRYECAQEHYEKAREIADAQGFEKLKLVVDIKLGDVFLVQKNVPKAFQYYYEALMIAKSSGNKEMEADVYEKLGDAFYSSSDYGRAIKNHNENLKMAIELGDMERQQQAHEYLGDDYAGLGKWSEAQKSYSSCCVIATNRNDNDAVYRCKKNMGIAYYILMEYENAIKCLEEAKSDKIYFIIGCAYAKIGQYEKSLEFLSKDLKTGTDQHDMSRQVTAHGIIGKVNVKTGKLQDAIECHQKALQLVQQSDDKEAEADVYCNLGCALQAIGQYDEAMKKQEKSLKLAENLKNKSQQGRAHKKIGNIHSAKGENEKAINSYYACLGIVEDMEISTTVRVLGKLGCMWRRSGQHENAIGCHEDQAHIADNLKDKARAFANLGTDYEFNCNYAKALEYQNKYLEVAKKMRDDIQQGHAYVKIGKVHLAKGEYKEAIMTSEIAENLDNQAYTGPSPYEMPNDMHRKEMDVIQFEANDNIGMGHVGTGDYDRAVVCFRKQMRLAKEIEDKRKEGRANENFGNYHAAIGECNEAMSYYNKSLEIAEEVRDKAGIGRLKGCIGTIYTEIGQYQNAVEWHKEERKIAEDLGNKVREGQALGNLGNAYTGLCEYQKAIELHEESLKIAKENVVQVDQRRANGNLGNTYMASGKYQEALEFQGKALKISQQLGHRGAQGRIHESMARAYYLSGQTKLAVECSQKSLRIARQVGDKAGKGRALGTLGLIELGQNNQTAISHIREYLRISEEHSNKADKGDALGSMAVVLIELGQYNKAFECCNESLKIAENLQDKARMGRAYENLGKFYMAVGQYEKAIENHCNHLKIAEKLGDRAEIGRANGNLGNAYNQNGQYEKAMKCHTIDKYIAEEFNNEAQVGQAQGNMGNTYTNMKQFEKGFYCHLRRLGIAKELNDKPSSAKALQGVGEYYINTDQCEKAIQHLERLEEISRPAHPDSRELTAHLDSLELTAIAQELLGKCYQKDDVSKACSYFAKSIVNFQTLRHSLSDHDEFNISMSNRFAHVHKLLLQSLLNLKEVKTALLVADCGKAQALHDLTCKIARSGLSSPSSYSDPMETIAKDPSSSTSKNLFNDKLKNVINSNQADTIISYAFGENDELHSWVFSQGRAFHKSLKITNGSSLRSYINGHIVDLYKKLDVGSAHADAMKDDIKAAQDFEARTCNPHWLMSDDIESDQKEIERLADTCSLLKEHDLLTTSQKPGPSTNSLAQQTAQNCYLQDLYNVSIQPIEEHLTGSKLLIVPEGPLFTLPFAGLLDPSGSHLCDKYSLQFIPSLLVLDSSLSTLPPPQLGPALFVGNPNGALLYLESLPSAEKEVIECSKHFNAQPLVLDMATKKNVLNGMKTASIIHIAAHGNMNRAEIFLTPNEGEPLSPSSYLLTAEDIQKCTLSARLVVLSCCHSGRGEISAEGVVGTARSFLGSGARAVLVALWPINDEATMKLVIELYKKLIQEHSLCAALQQAMMVLKRRYPSPRFWAPFQVFGEDIVLTRQEIEKIRLVSASR